MSDLFNTSVGKVRLNDDMRRVERLPRRCWAQVTETMTEVLKSPLGSQELRSIQAVALYELGTVGGLFGPIKVGAGKTLISLLAPEVAFSKRPLLLVPAGLIGKTQRDRNILIYHWGLPEYIRIMSYEWLGRVQAVDALSDYMPDLIIADEAHRLKNLNAAVTRRVRRHMHQFPETRFVAMSGTITKRSIHDFAHILGWTHKNGSSPLPKAYTDLELWADALDERKGQTKRADPGALEVLCNKEELEMWDMGEPRKAARLAFQRRLVDTPGVVATKESTIDASIVVRGVEPSTESPGIEKAFDDLRALWETPDGWPIADGLTMNRHARELALGFFYVWDPRPPMSWLLPRREWFSFVRRILSHSQTLDSELAVRQKIHRNPTPESLELLEAWLDVRDTFKPNTVARWIDDTVIDQCARWAHTHRGIVWTGHTCFGERLAERSGLDYYGRKGLNAQGRYVEDHPHGEPLIASIASNSTGRNLQYGWSKNLITSMPANGLQTEQLFGRTHREYQTADEVLFDVVVGCVEHVGAFWQAMRDSQYTFELTGSPQKMLVADVDVATADEIESRCGSRWNKE